MRTREPSAGLDEAALLTIGVISDTHGSIPERVFEVFAGVDRIIHAGDIGSSAILCALEEIAPVTAVLGNCDGAIPGWALSPFAILRLGLGTIAVGHELLHLTRERNLDEFGATVVVCGHTHVARVQRVGQWLVVNPGSASRPRASTRGTVAVLALSPREPRARVVHL